MVDSLALPGITDFPEEFHPQVRVRHSRRMKRVKPRAIEEVLTAGFRPHQVAAALSVDLKTLEVWRRHGHLLRPSSVSKAKALRDLKKIAARRLRCDYHFSMTASWWDTCQENLGGKRPRTVFLVDPKRVLDSIKPWIATRRIQLESDGTSAPPWMDLE